MLDELKIRSQQPGPGVEMIGPFSDGSFKACMDGYKVPWIKGRPTNIQRTEWAIILDERFCITLPEDRLEDFIWFVANAMAIGNGYHSFQNACEHQADRWNQFGTQMIGIESVGQEESENTEAREE